MNAVIEITGLEKAEQDARAILEHVEAIKNIQRGAAWTSISVKTDLKEEAASDS